VFNDSQAIFDSGGAIYFKSDPDYTAVTTITSSQFHANKAASGSAIASRGQLNIKNCVIDSNEASLTGGGLYILSTDTNYNDTTDVVYTDVTISNTNITNNSCTQKAGAVYIDDYVNAIITQVSAIIINYKLCICTAVRCAAPTVCQCSTNCLSLTNRLL
jgi:hypothetical protein